MKFLQNGEIGDLEEKEDMNIQILPFPHYPLFYVRI